MSSRRPAPPPESFEDFQASVLFCGRCRVARPVRQRLLLVLPDGELYTAWIQSVPYARVHIAEILTAVDNFLARDLPPPRGSA